MKSAGFEPGQVFHDADGKRRRSLLLLAVVLVLLLSAASPVLMNLSMASASATPMLAAELDESQKPGFPRQVATSQSVPLIGDTAHGVLTRVARVVRADGRTMLRDPFNAQIWRDATPDEVAIIKDAAYVMERFGRPADKQLMLTFDDGPHPVNTPEILDVLKEYGVPATFFTIGANVAREPGLVQRELAEGHMIAGHTMDHTPDFYGQTDEENRKQLLQAQQMIRSAANYESSVWRIPESQAELKPLAVLTGQQLGFIQADFDIDTHDWEVEAQHPGAVLDTPKLDGQGHVIVMHDGGGNRLSTADMLRRLIVEARAQGYSFTTMSSLLPEQYQPLTASKVSTNDLMAFEGYRLMNVLPVAVIRYVTLVGAVLFVMSTMTFTLSALIHDRKARKRRFDGSYQPLTSVIVPVFNESKIILATLSSLVRRTYRNIEVIVIDDGSTDGTARLAQEFADRTPNIDIRVYRQANQGKAAALNHGINRAQGDIIITMDGDTLFQPQTVARLVRHFADPSVGVVGGHVRVGNRGRRLLTWWQSAEYLVGICLNRAADSLLGTISVTPGACSAYRRQALYDAGLFSTRTRAEDADMTLSIRALGYTARQENRAIAITEVPVTVRALYKQRLRWVFGYFQVLYVHRKQLVRPATTALGAALWYNLVSLVITALFMPLLLASLVVQLYRGFWEGPALVLGIILAVHSVQLSMALVMSGESWRHALLIPVFQLVSEPLRLSVLYSSLFFCVVGIGMAFSWNKDDREGAMAIPVLAEAAAIP